MMVASRVERAEPPVRVRAVVTGLVQGVWFRQGCVAEAERAGVTGWVRNRGDGSVEAELEGGADAVATVLAWMRSGPPAARVERLDIEERAPAGERGFEVR